MRRWDLGLTAAFFLQKPTQNQQDKDEKNTQTQRFKSLLVTVK